MIRLGAVMAIADKAKPTRIDKDKLIKVKLHLKGVCKNDSSDSLLLGATSYYIRKKGQFIYGKQNLFNGAFGIIPDELDGFLSSGDVPALDIDHSKINKLYLLYFLGQRSFYKRLEDIATGSGSKRIHESTFLNIEILLPSLEEQNEISALLTTLDEKINMENKILVKYESQRKSLLTKLFI